MGRFFVSGVVALLLTAAPAHAADPWSPPQTVSAATGQIPLTRIGVDAQGFTRLSWVAQEPIPDHRNNYPAAWRLALREPGAAEFGPEGPDEWSYFDPVLYGRDRLLGLSRRYIESTNPPALETMLFARFGNTRGKLDFIQDIVRLGDFPIDENAVRPALAVLRDAVATWAEDRLGSGVDHIYASVRTLGGRFGAPVKLARRRDVKFLVAGSGPGVVFVAWERRDVVEARVKRRGRGWGPVQRVGVTHPEVTPSSFEVAFSGRRAYLAWVSAPFDGTHTVRVAVLPGGRTRFRRAQKVELVFQEPRPSARRIALVPLPRHGALLGWTGWDGQRARAWVARTGRGARFGREVSVAPPGESAVLGDLEAGPNGVLAVWTRLDARGLGDRVRAAFRRPGGSFGPPEDVSDLDRAGLAVDAAFDPVGNRWTVAWPQSLQPAFDPFYRGSNYLRAATRPG